MKTPALLAGVWLIVRFVADDPGSIIDEINAGTSHVHLLGAALIKGPFKYDA